MASITIRSTYAFDPETVARIKKLAQTWGVSQSEAIRRAVRKVEQESQNPYAGMTPLQVLEHAMKHPVLTKEEVERQLRDLEERRKTLFEREDG